MSGGYKQYLIITNITLLFACVVVFLGGWTRLNYAGLGCPDWPGCYGELIMPGDEQRLAFIQQRYPEQPIDTYKSWLEMIHRYAAGSLGLLVLLLCYLRVRWSKATMVVGYLPFIILFIVVVQAIFGMLTVTLKLLPIVVTLHLLGGLTTLGLLLLLRLKQGSKPIMKSPQIKLEEFQNWVRLTFAVLVLQILLGGWTSANYAGWACSDWITCGNNVVLDFEQGFSLATDISKNYEGGVLSNEARAAIQVTHKTVGALFLILITVVSIKYFTVSKQVRNLLITAVVLSYIQAALGVANIIFGVPLNLATAHHAGAVVLLLSLVWLYKASHEMVGGKYA